MQSDGPPSSLRKRFTYLPPQETQDYGSLSNYCEAVRRAITPHQTAQELYKQAVFAYQAAVARQRAQPQPTFNLTVPPGVNVQNIHIQINRIGAGGGGAAMIHLPNGNRSITNNYTPAPFLKRVLAELIDFFIFFLIKVIIVWFIIDKLELIDLDEFEKLLSNHGDLGTLIDVTQSLFPYELLCKIIVTIFEGFCLSYPIFPGFRGATPGKMVMRIKVISCKTLIPMNAIPGNVTVVGLESIPFKSAIMRSLVKNLFINSLLPLSTLAFAFNQNRSVYDIMSQTMVVEAY